MVTPGFLVLARGRPGGRGRLRRLGRTRGGWSDPPVIQPVRERSKGRPLPLVGFPTVESSPTAIDLHVLLPPANAEQERA
jgi:hypothetical protein